MRDLSRAKIQEDTWDNTFSLKLALILASYILYLEFRTF